MKFLPNHQFFYVWNHTVRFGAYNPQTKTITCPPYRIEGYSRDEEAKRESGTLYLRDEEVYDEDAMA